MRTESTNNLPVQYFRTFDTMEDVQAMRVALEILCSLKGDLKYFFVRMEYAMHEGSFTCTQFKRFARLAHDVLDNPVREHIITCLAVVWGNHSRGNIARITSSIQNRPN